MVFGCLYLSQFLISHIIIWSIPPNTSPILLNGDYTSIPQPPALLHGDSISSLLNFSHTTVLQNTWQGWDYRRPSKRFLFSRGYTKLKGAAHVFSYWVTVIWRSQSQTAHALARLINRRDVIPGWDWHTDSEEDLLFDWYMKERPFSANPNPSIASCSTPEEQWGIRDRGLAGRGMRTGWRGNHIHLSG